MYLLCASTHCPSQNKHQQCWSAAFPLVSRIGLRGYLYLMLVALRYKESSRAWAVALRFEPQRNHKKRSRKIRLLFCDTSIDIPPKSPFVKGGLKPALRSFPPSHLGKVDKPPLLSVWRRVLASLQLLLSLLLPSRRSERRA